MGSEQEAWRPLFVGSVVGGSSSGNRLIRVALGRLARIVDAFPWESGADEIGVDAVFHITGPLMAPDYSGIRSGRFSKPDRLIAIQIAVPVALEELSEDEATRALSRLLVEATELAGITVAQRKDAPSVSQAISVAKRVMNSIA
jgi:hypothetical protein